MAPTIANNGTAEFGFYTLPDVFISAQQLAANVVSFAFKSAGFMQDGAPAGTFYLGGRSPSAQAATWFAADVPTSGTQCLGTGQNPSGLWQISSVKGIQVNGQLINDTAANLPLTIDTSTPFLVVPNVMYTQIVDMLKLPCNQHTISFDGGLSICTLSKKRAEGCGTLSIKLNGSLISMQDLFIPVPGSDSDCKVLFAVATPYDPTGSGVSKYIAGTSVWVGKELTLDYGNATGFLPDNPLFLPYDSNGTCTYHAVTPMVGIGKAVEDC